MIREAPEAHTAEVHRAGGAHGKIASRDGARGAGTGALIADRVYGAYRNVVKTAGGKPREPEAHTLAGSRA